jgi:hypothetical protein
VAVDKALLQQAQEELLRRQREDPLEYVYTPNKNQIAAHKSRVDITVVLGANRAGKSHFTMAESLLTVIGREKYAPHRWIHEHGLAPVVWYVMPATTQARRAIFPKFWDMTPRKYMLPGKEGWSESKKVAQFRTQLSTKIVGTFHFLSAEMRQIRLQGAAVDLAIMDETPDEGIFNELVARLVDRNGRIILAFSPIDERANWVRDKLYIPWSIGERDDINFISMPVADDEGKVVVPHLTQKKVDRMFRQWPDPAEREARIFGRFTQRRGLVFGQFRPEVHVIPAFRPPEGWTRFWMVDPQYHRFAALFFAVDPQGRYFVTAEYFSQDETLAQRAGRMKALTYTDGVPNRVLPVYVDYANPQDVAELNWHFRRIEAKLGAIPLPVKKNVDDMLLRVHNLLEVDEDREYPKEAGMQGVFGAPRIFIFEDVQSVWRLDERRMHSSRMLWEISHLAWGRNSKPDKKTADGADCCDCLAYACSILAKGRESSDPLAWTRGLSEADIIIRQAERRMNKMQKLYREGEL